VAAAAVAKNDFYKSGRICPAPDATILQKMFFTPAPLQFQTTLKFKVHGIGRFRLPSQPAVGQPHYLTGVACSLM
jgi:hypothetical protein